MIRKLTYTNYALLLLIFTLISCANNPMGVIIPPRPNSIYIEYSASGGWVGYNYKITIDENNIILILDTNLNIIETIDEEKYIALIDLFYDNNFFELENEYTTSEPWIDAPTTRIYFETEEYSKSVISVPGSETPDNYFVIMAGIRQLISEYEDNVTSGKINFYDTFTLEIWPFFESHPLSQIIGNRIPLSETISNYLGDRVFRKVKFFENDIIYDINFYENDNRYTEMRVIEHYSPFYWNNESNIPIESFGSEGLYITGNTFQNMLTYLYGNNPNYFIDGNIENGKLLYRMQLFKGNGYENTSTFR